MQNPYDFSAAFTAPQPAAPAAPTAAAPAPAPAQPQLSFQDWLWNNYRIGGHNIANGQWMGQHKNYLDQYSAYLAGHGGSGGSAPGDFTGLSPVAGGKWSDTDLMHQIIRRMISGGYFNPTGSPEMNAMYKDAAAVQTNDAIRRAGLGADARGLSPEQANYARTMAEVGASGAAARGATDFQMQDAIASRDWLRGLIGKEFDYNFTVKPPM